MSEQSSQLPDRTTVHDPQAHGFPVELSSLKQYLEDTRQCEVILATSYFAERLSDSDATPVRFANLHQPFGPAS